MRLTSMPTIGALCCSIAAALFDARAASYPDRPIRLIVATTEGDRVGLSTAKHLTK